MERGRIIHVAIAPVSKSHENILPPSLAVTLSLILSPLKGVIRLKNSLHVAMETVYKFKISCGMTLGALMRGAILLFTRKTKLSVSLFSLLLAVSNDFVLDACDLVPVVFSLTLVLTDFT